MKVRLAGHRVARHPVVVCRAHESQFGATVLAVCQFFPVNHIFTLPSFRRNLTASLLSGEPELPPELGLGYAAVLLAVFPRAFGGVRQEEPPLRRTRPLVFPVDYQAAADSEMASLHECDLAVPVGAVHKEMDVACRKSLQFYQNLRHEPELPDGIRSSEFFLEETIQVVEIIRDDRVLYKLSKKSSSAFSFFGSELLKTTFAPFAWISSTNFPSLICSSSPKPSLV